MLERDEPPCISHIAVNIGKVSSLAYKLSYIDTGQHTEQGSFNDKQIRKLNRTASDFRFYTHFRVYFCLYYGFYTHTYTLHTPCMHKHTIPPPSARARIDTIHYIYTYVYRTKNRCIPTFLLLLDARCIGIMRDRPFFSIASSHSISCSLAVLGLRFAALSYGLSVACVYGSVCACLCRSIRPNWRIYAIHNYTATHTALGPTISQ